MENQPISEIQPQKNLIPKIIWVVAVLIFLAGLFYFSNGQISRTGQANLSWNANTESDLSGYKIYYGLSPRSGDCPEGGYLQKVDVGKTAAPENPAYKLENLENGRTYYFSVTSYDAAGNESCFSAEMSKAIPAVKQSWLDKISNLFKF